MTLEQLPRFELYEQGAQIRRSSKSIRANIVEGFGKRRYKQEFLQYLHNAFASSLETIDHLECLYETGSLTDQQAYDTLHGQAELLGRKLNVFIAAVQRVHISEK